MVTVLMGKMLLLWVIAATWATGEVCLRRLRLKWANGVQHFVFAGALGLGLWLLALFFTGWLVAFNRFVGLAVTGVFTIPAVVLAVEWARAEKNPIKLPAWDRLTCFLAGLCGIVVVLSFAGGFAPVAGIADALTYHLNLPKEFIRAGKIYALAYDPNSVFPLLLHMGFGFGLLFGSPAFANLLAVWVGVLAAAAVYGWAREKVSPAYAWLGTAAFVLTPAVYNHFNVPYVDLALALYAMLAFWAFCGWTRTREIPWLALSGVFCGFALGMKYLAIVYALILFVAILWETVCRRRELKSHAQPFIVFAFFAAVTGFIWYARSSWEMGNPLYPFVSNLFGGKPSVADVQFSERTYGVGYGLRHLLTLFWDATFQPGAYAGFGTRWNLLFLGLLPLVIWGIVRKQGGWLAVFAFAVLLSWFFMSQVMRFLMAFFPLYCILIAWACQNLESLPKALRKTVWAWVLAVCLWETACVAAHAKPQIGAAISGQAREQYLRGRERSYAVAEWVNAYVSSSARILSDGEVRFFYFKPALVREYVWRIFSPYPYELESSKLLAMYLKERGFTHVLIAEDLKAAPPSPRPEHRAVLKDLAKDPESFTLLHESGFDSGNEKMQYRLYAILPAGEEKK